MGIFKTFLNICIPKREILLSNPKTTSTRTPYSLTNAEEVELEEQLLHDEELGEDEDDEDENRLLHTSC